jgi:hypothetical protein
MEEMSAASSSVVTRMEIEEDSWISSELTDKLGAKFILRVKNIVWNFFKMWL